MKKSTLIIAMLTALLAASPASVAYASQSEIAAAAKKKTETVVFATNMHCKNCTNKVRENLSYEKGVKDLEVDLKSNRITVTFDPSKTDKATLAKAINKLGYKAEEVSPEESKEEN